MKQLQINNVDKCYNCGSSIIEEGNSLHCWDIKYECGCILIGLISNDKIYIQKECTIKK